MATPETPSLSQVFTSAQQSYINDQCFLLEKLPGIYKRVTENLTTRAGASGSADEPFIRMPGETNTSPTATKGGPRVRQLFNSDAAYGYTNPFGNVYTRHEQAMNGASATYGSIDITTNLNYIDWITGKTLGNHFKTIMNLKPDQITKMAHFVTVREVLEEKGKPNSPKNQKDFIFKESHLKEWDKASILSKTAQRTSAGILDINVIHEGIDSATKNIVLVNVKYIFQDIREMMNDNYVRLFTLDTQKTVAGANTPSNTQSRSQTKFNRSIEFVIGWNNQESLGGVAHLRSMIDDLRLKTHLVSYTFDLNQNGSIIVDAKYRGHMVETFSGPGANILQVAKERFKLYAEKMKDLESVVEANTKTSLESMKKDSAKKLLLGELQNDLLSFLMATTYSTSKMDRTGSKGVIETFFKDSTPRFPSGGPDREFLTNSALPGLARGIRKATGASAPDILSMRDNIKKNAELFFSGPGKGPTVVRRELRSYLEEIERQIDLLEGNIKTTSDNIDRAIVNAQGQILNQAQYQQYLAIQAIVETIMKNQDIYYAVVDKQTITDFKVATASGNPSQVKSVLSAIPADRLLHDKKSYKALYGSGRPAEKRLDEEQFQVVPYVFFGHLLEIILGLPAALAPTGADGKIKFDYKKRVLSLMLDSGPDFHIDLGYLSYKTPFTAEDAVNYPIYFLPVSLKELNNFFVRKVLAENRSVYTVHDFVLDMIKKFWAGAFNNCGSESFAQTYTPSKLATTLGNFEEDFMDTPKRPGTGNIQYFIHSQKSIIEDLKGLKLNTKKFGKYNENINRNIPHFFLFGSQTGIDLSIKIRDISDPLLKQAVYYKSRASAQDAMSPGGTTSSSGLIPAVFQAEVETIGMPFFNIGQLIYIDLEPFIDATLEATRPFKASGYYAITKVTHNFSQNKFTTKIEAIIQLSRVNKNELNAKPSTAKSAGVSPTVTKIANAAKSKKDALSKKITVYEETIIEEPGSGGKLKKHFEERNTKKPGAGILP